MGTSVQASDKHYEILASHGRFDAIPDDRRAKAISDANATIAAQRANFSDKFGGIFGASSGRRSQPRPSSDGYKGFRDRFDGGGQRMAGARFARGDVSMFDKDGDGYISELEFQSAETEFPDIYQKQVMGGIPSLSNMVGARPLGSYEQERNLGQDGTNIGTSGIANYVAGGGMFGPLFGGAPNRLQQAMPNMRPDQQFTYKNLTDSGMTHQQAMEFLGFPAAPPPRKYSPRPMLRPTPIYGPPTTPQTVVGYNMGGLMALRDYNMGMQMGMGQSV